MAAAAAAEKTYHEYELCPPLALRTASHNMAWLRTNECIASLISCDILSTY